MYKTGFLKVKTQILETIFAELPQTAKKVKLTLKFDDEEKLNAFKRLEAERKEVEEDCGSLDSGSDSEDDSKSVSENPQIKDDQSKNIKSDKLELNKSENERLRVQKIDIGLEEGIIYKQYYEKQFTKIGESFKVKINIRAQKITFEGYEIEDIEDAMVDVNQLRQNIDVEYIPKYGLQMSQSEMIRRELENVGVKIFRILDKYYRWYEISSKLSRDDQKEKRKDIKNKLNAIDKGNHCLQYLYSIEQDIDTFKGSLNNDFLKLRLRFMNYKPLLQKLKGRIFVNEVMQIINGESKQDELQAQLSISRDAVVFHSLVKEFLQMTIKQVRVHFQSYQYFFLTIDSDQPIQQAITLLQQYQYQSVMESTKSKSIIGQIQQVKDINYIHFTTNYEQVKEKIQRKISDPTFYGDYMPKESVIFCVAFRKKYPQDKLEYLCEMLKKLLNIWRGASFKFSIFLDQEEEIQDNKVTYEFNTIEKLFSISANQNSLQTNLFILRNYILKKKVESLKNKYNLENQEHNVSISIINASQLIQDSSTLIQDSNTSFLGELKNQHSQIDILRQNPPKDHDQKAMQFLKGYSVFLAETSKQYNEKYKESDVKQNDIVSTNKRNRSLQEDLSSISDSRFQVLKIKLNPSHKVDNFYENSKRDEIITVFVSQRVSPFVKPKEIGLKIEQGLNDTFPIRLLTAKEPITESGHLINIKKKSIEIHGKSFKISYGSEFQVAKTVTYLKKI